MQLTLKQYGRWYVADTQTPVRLFLNLVGDGEGILLESSEVDGRLGRYSLIAWDYRLVLESKDGKLCAKSVDPQFAELAAELDGQPFVPGLRQAIKSLRVLPENDFANLPAMTRGFCGYFGYGLCSHFEPCLAPHVPPEDADSVFVLPGKMIVFDHLYNKCAFLSLDPDAKPEPATIPSAGPRCHVGPVSTTPGKEEYMQGVEKARELICEGEAIQIVLSTRFSAEFSGSAFQIYRSLRQINPSPYTFYMNLGDTTLLGSSPELMVRCEGDHLQLRPIAGTRPRGRDDREDQALAANLLADPKERAEHVMLVDLGRNDLGRIATPGSVTVDKYMQVERFSHVMHLTSYLSAKLLPGLDALDLLAAVFPAGTVSGAPKIRAMEIIADTEKTDRGPYAGCIGWLGLDKNGVHMDTGITIRSLWIRDGQLHWQAGAGIVSDSVPENEWNECRNKAMAMQQAITCTGGGDDFTY